MAMCDVVASARLLTVMVALMWTVGDGSAVQNRATSPPASIYVNPTGFESHDQCSRGPEHQLTVPSLLPKPLIFPRGPTNPHFIGYGCSSGVFSWETFSSVHNRWPPYSRTVPGLQGGAYRGDVSSRSRGMTLCDRFSSYFQRNSSSFTSLNRQSAPPRDVQK